MFKLISLVSLVCIIGASAEERLYDFTAGADTSLWVEQSDTVRTGVGQSKAALVTETNGSFTRAVLFALLNLVNDAGFAGMRILDTHDLSAYTEFVVYARAQGEFNNWKMVLRHQGLNSNTDFTYEYFFEAPTDFAEIRMPFADFAPYFRGVQQNSTVLDTSQVSAIGLQFYGGVYVDNVQQQGPGTLEIDYIAVA